MAERKATNKYYPPEWNPSKGSINTFKGSHPLRERARKLDQGILVVRFELPYNIWCDGCNNHIGMGVRYNAEKSKVGMYHSTPVFQFRCKCHLCDSYFVLKTDPQNLDYIVESGARRQERRWDPVENEQIEVDKAIKKRISLDPMFKLEHDVVDKAKAATNKSAIENLEHFQEDRWKDDYSSNCDVRKLFRTEKKQLKDIARKESALLQRSSLPISLNLAAETSSDVKLAKLASLQSKHSFEQNRLLKRRDIMKQSIFDSSKRSRLKLFSRSSSTTTPLSASSLKAAIQVSTKKCRQIPSSTIVPDYSSDSD